VGRKVGVSGQGKAPDRRGRGAARGGGGAAGSIFERTMRPFAADPTAAAADGPSWDKLRIALQHQEQTEWCWAAVAASVADFNKDPAGWTQCRIANAVLGSGGCCTSGGTCNKTAELARSLEVTGHLRAPEVGTLDPSTVGTEMLNENPIGAHVVFPGGIGHFVLITGFLDAEPPRLWVQDSEVNERSDYEFGEFAQRYRGNARWDHSYFTK
jgi:hypothetical protein